MACSDVVVVVVAVVVVCSSSGYDIALYLHVNCKE